MDPIMIGGIIAAALKELAELAAILGKVQRHEEITEAEQDVVKAARHRHADEWDALQDRDH